MFIYCCSKCRMVDIGDENDVKNCMRCGTPMLSLGLSSSDWNKLNDEQMKEAIDNCIAKDNGSTLPNSNEEKYPTENNLVNETPKTESNNIPREQSNPSNPSNIVTESKKPSLYNQEPITTKESYNSETNDNRILLDQNGTLVKDKINLITCTECGEVYSFNEKYCPSCGYDNNEQKQDISKKAVRKKQTNPTEEATEETTETVHTNNNFRIGVILATIGFVVSQIGTYSYNYAQSWGKTLSEYGTPMSSLQKYKNQMNTGNSIFVIGAIVFIIGYILCIKAIKRGDVSEKVRKFNWGLLSITIEVGCIAIAFFVGYVKYEAFFNAYLIICGTILGLIISLTDIIMHKGNKRIASVIGLIIGIGLLVFSII